MSKKIYLSPPHLNGDELQYIRDAIDSNWIAPVGPHVDGFETELASLLKVQHVLSVNSGTSAIHLGLLALGVKPGDEVICSTFTFCASANPIIYCGATPVFVDSEDQTWNMDPALLEESITDRIKKTGQKPKAIILVHLYGMPAVADKIIEIAEKYEVPVLEDAAEALGSIYKGQQAGTFGAAGIFSFNGNKIITTSGGGALISPDINVMEIARHLRQEAKEPLPYYLHKTIGYNYRMSNLLAALGRSQLKVLEERVIKRRKIFDFYADQLKPIDTITFQAEPMEARSNRWLTCIIVRDPAIDREKIRLALLEDNIESRPLWNPMHLQPVFKSFPAYLNGVSDDLFNHGLCLPSGSNMTEQDMERIAGIIKSLFV